jgi:glycogen synthase
MKALDDIDATRVLPPWQRPTEALKACFRRYDVNANPVSATRGGNEDLDRILAARPSDGWRTVVFLSYENPRGASGGILAVIRRLPAEMQRLLVASEPDRPRELIRLSPHHARLRTHYQPDELTPVGECAVSFDGRDVQVRISRYRDAAGEEWHLFGADGFFEADGGIGNRDPYIYSRETASLRDGDQSLLLRDSLFATKAVPAILRQLGKTDGLIVHAHDWEFACAALTVREAIIAGELHRAAVVLTLHNPYDHGLSETALARITTRHASQHWPHLGGMGRSTVLTRMIPLLDAPVSVVSHQFAREMTSAPIQTGVFTTHLQGVFRTQGLVGIDNGTFKAPTVSFSPVAIRDARAGKPAAILAEKKAKRQTMLQALKGYLDDLENTGDCAKSATLTIGTLTGGAGKPLTELDDSIPVYMMVGRLDPGQKGYDLCAQLIASQPPGAARFVLTPMSSLATDPAVNPFFDQLRELAAARPGDVVIFAHQMGRAYAETMAGATYGLWPSRYEPFGGVTEFYASGTPVVAHAVGGLAQQVIDFNDAPADGTGILYRDTAWRGVPQSQLEKEYATTQHALPYDRSQVAEYRAECVELKAAVRCATTIFQHHPASYGAMLANLSDMLGVLGWDKPVRDYLSWYEKALS